MPVAGREASVVAVVKIYVFPEIAYKPPSQECLPKFTSLKLLDLRSGKEWFDDDVAKVEEKLPAGAKLLTEKVP